jgi:hypothetical protein
MTTFTPRDTTTEELRKHLAGYEQELETGLSKQARTATRIKAQAIRIVLQERGAAE